MTILDVIQKGTGFLSQRSVDSPRLQVELLLAHVLQIPRLQLYLAFDRKLTPNQIDVLRKLIRRRGERVPLQHLVGTAPFMHFNLEVNSHVLIPRPETETLVQIAVQSIPDLKQAATHPFSILDLGTGTGCIAIALATRFPEIEVVAMDISSEALHVARRNADAHAVGNRIEWLLGDGFADFSAGGPLSGRKFDRILTNPPYIPTDEIASLDAEVRDFDPHLALDGGPDGLDFYRVLADRGSVLLNPGGMLIAEFGDGQENVLERLFTTAAWNSLRFEKDLSGRNRILIVSCMDPRSR